VRLAVVEALASELLEHQAATWHRLLGDEADPGAIVNLAMQLTYELRGEKLGPGVDETPVGLRLALCLPLSARRFFLPVPGALEIAWDQGRTTAQDESSGGFRAVILPGP
jgi:hypothetical protein